MFNTTLKETAELKRTSRIGKIKNTLLSVVSAIAVLSGVVTTTPYISSEINRNNKPQIELIKDQQFESIIKGNIDTENKWTLHPDRTIYFLYDIKNEKTTNALPFTRRKVDESYKNNLGEYKYLPGVVGQKITVDKSNFTVIFKEILFENEEPRGSIRTDNVLNESQLKEVILDSKQILVIFPGLENRTDMVEGDIASNWLYENNKPSVMIEISPSNQKYNDNNSLNTSLNNIIGLTFKDYLSFATLIKSLGGKDVIADKEFILVGTSYGASQTLELANRLVKMGNKVSKILLISPLIQLGPSKDLPSDPLKVTTHIWTIQAFKGLDWIRNNPDLNILNEIPTFIIYGENDELIDPKMLGTIPEKYKKVKIYKVKSASHALEISNNYLLEDDNRIKLKVAIKNFFDKKN